MSDPYLYALGATALIILVVHWLPWPRRLHRLIAYGIGVASILAGLAIWLGATGRWGLWLMILGIAAAAGLATALAWFIDWLFNLMQKDRIHESTGRPDDRP